MALGILEQVGLAATLIFALPVAVYGVQTILDGSTLFGAVAVLIAVLMVVLPRRLTSPDDVPAKAAETAVDAVVDTPDGSDGRDDR
ncbi:DUF7533 family protein [Halobaculum magnesiiphilum]|uniref:Uncharacterized protein n=1 Tax=Halobaculum magnesiiphilum TaxID=1017351 RepID=A0A8T8WAU0_9EURY|nr:hypothetical protein [Halobaculum magnesiiphilum]QZP36982.1 hypothetical protein K6T50_11865 [Halobaculum magnesiiphilum]